MKNGLALLKKYRQQLAYLFFGGVTTLINIAVYRLAARAGLPTAAANALAWAAAVAAAYVTNRLWVFESRSRGAALAREFASFVGARVATGVMDEAVMVLGVDALGPALGLGGSAAWSLGVKVFSNILVVILNYVLSKKIIFRRGGE